LQYFASAILPGSAVFDAFLGLWGREKPTLSHTAAMQKTSEIVGLKKISTPKNLQA
jgi:hypothetical protein